MGLPHTEPRDSLDVTRSNLPAETQVVVLDYRH
jgi:hypothetical protein